MYHSSLGWRVIKKKKIWTRIGPGGGGLLAHCYQRVVWNQKLVKTVAWHLHKFDRSNVIWEGLVFSGQIDKGLTEILVEQQPPQGVLVCDHAGLVINTFSLKGAKPG